MLGMTSSVSPLRTQPASDLPITTVPRSLNLSMTAMRKGARASRAGISVESSSSNSVGPGFPLASVYQGLQKTATMSRVVHFLSLQRAPFSKTLSVSILRDGFSAEWLHSLRSDRGCGID